MELYSRRLGGEHTVQWSAARLNSDCSAVKEHGYYITADGLHLGLGPPSSTMTIKTMTTLCLMHINDLVSNVIPRHDQSLFLIVRNWSYNYDQSCSSYISSELHERIPRPLSLMHSLSCKAIGYSFKKIYSFSHLKIWKKYWSFWCTCIFSKWFHRVLWIQQKVLQKGLF